MGFQETVRSMTGKEIVMAMVNGLEREWVKVDMDYYGRRDGAICFGCAATNTICQIAGKSFNADSISLLDERAIFLQESRLFLKQFECAINSLRHGNIREYNYYAYSLGIAKLSKPPERPLPFLNTVNYKENLPAYKSYADNL